MLWSDDMKDAEQPRIITGLFQPLMANREDLITKMHERDVIAAHNSKSWTEAAGCSRMLPEAYKVA